MLANETSHGWGEGAGPQATARTLDDARFVTGVLGQAEVRVCRVGGPERLITSLYLQPACQCVFYSHVQSNPTAVA